MAVFEDPRAPGHAELRYRPDVDGLHAVAVPCVLFYHHGFSQVLYPHEVLCATGRCELSRNDRPPYRDEHHLSVFGAMQLVPLLRLSDIVRRFCWGLTRDVSGT